MSNNSIILSKKYRLEIDEECLNKNICVIGAPGSGKTHSFLKPNILQLAEAGHSMVISDTKGNLVKKYGLFLEDKGYDVKVFNLIETDKSITYDPIYNVRTERDVLTLATIMGGRTCDYSDPFWHNSAVNFIQSMIAAVCFEQTGYPRKMSSVSDLFTLENYTKISEYAKLIDVIARNNPDSMAVRLYKAYSVVKGAESTTSGILSIASEMMMPFMNDAALRLYADNELKFEDIGKKKTAVFVIISDNDRSMDKHADIFFSQLLNVLIKYADTKCENSRLPVPVSILIDDFGTQTVIPDFDCIIAAARSRNISLGIILQSVGQLRKAYNTAADIIIACCDTQLYFGGNDYETVRLVSQRADRSVHDIMNMPYWKVWVLRRGMGSRIDDAFDLSEHPEHTNTGEYDPLLSYELESRHFNIKRKSMNYDELSYDLLVSADLFRKNIYYLFYEQFGREFKVDGKMDSKTNIAYCLSVQSGDKRFLCLFERRKSLLDDFYYNFNIEPILSKFNENEREIDYVLLVSFSGFTYEEEKYADEHKICLVNREGFENSLNQKGNTILNLHNFEDLKRKHDMHRRK